MEIIFKFYEPGQRFEEIQAGIYNQATKAMGSQVNVTPKQIKQRYDSEKPDPKGICYAFDDKGTPLAYVQTRVTESEDGEKRIYLGYPWGIESCPQYVKDQLFDKVFNYMTQKESTGRIVMGYWFSTWRRPIEFAEKRGFKIADENPQYAIDVKNVQIDHQSEYQNRIATKDDIPLLVELVQSDPVVNKFFPHEGAIERYFSERVIPDGHTRLIFKGDLLVCAGAPLEGYSAEGVILRFSAQRPSYDSAWNTLILALCDYFYKMEWENERFLVSPSGYESRIEFLKKIDAKIHTNQVLYELKRN